MPFVKSRMKNDLAEGPRVSEESFTTDHELQNSAFERLGKDIVIIEVLSIMNIIFAVLSFSLLGLLLRERNK
ncbi:hypothetical protein BU679_07900 [Staphylococcus chromogenes]|uniref:hypothetical protein n=1 Tax=Staphylococcus chromogenes TaxID=46126 RepID=UPI000D1B91D6|nr:hypothetical protein [Staphylococcus chromogenes]MCE4966329.1 hypothetical protein [Staphylococcus chromogenes]PTF74539.1 hypothetical protein BUX97_09035 [Staphylococcus chromogenes]PTG51059.1 hypothetical protein BU679_07900 [Staphylococcus chromogenes]